MKIEHIGLPAPGSGVFVPKKRRFYISMRNKGVDGSYSLLVNVSVMPSANRWRGHTVMMATGVTDNDNPMELRKNLRILAEAAYGG